MNRIYVFLCRAEAVPPWAQLILITGVFYVVYTLAVTVATSPTVIKILFGIVGIVLIPDTWIWLRDQYEILLASNSSQTNWRARLWVSMYKTRYYYRYQLLFLAFLAGIALLS